MGKSSRKPDDTERAVTRGILKAAIVIFLVLFLGFPVLRAIIKEIRMANCPYENKLLCE